MRVPRAALGRRELLVGAACWTIGAAGRVTGSSAGVATPALVQVPTIPTRGTHLVLLGTQGGPNVFAARGESASAVVVDGQAYLVDCGYGTLLGLRNAGLTFRDVATVFLSHLRDDHSGDVAALLSHQWTDGRVSTTTVYGPYGTERLVTAAVAFSEANVTIRLVDEDRSIDLADIARGRDIEATASPLDVYADSSVTVRSIENAHFPDSAKQRMPYRSLSYRFESRDRSIVFSGDTPYSTGLIALARGTDVLVCEAMDVVSMRRGFDQIVANGAYADNPEGVWQHIVETHTSTEDAGRMAAEAGVETLVLNHLLPGALNEIADEVYVEGARAHFDGDVIVGRDLMVL